MPIPVELNYQRDASWVGVYSTTASLNGTATTPNTFLSLFNPAASGRNLILLSFAVESYSVGISAATNVLQLDRVSSATVGSVLADPPAEFVQADPAPVAVVRVANPTIVAVGGITKFAPNQNITAEGTTGVSRREYRLDASWGEFLLAEGEGVALHQSTAGDADQKLLLTVVWAER